MLMLVKSNDVVADKNVLFLISYPGFDLPHELVGACRAAVPHAGGTWDPCIFFSERSLVIDNP